MGQEELKTVRQVACCSLPTWLFINSSPLHLTPLSVCAKPHHNQPHHNRGRVQVCSTSGAMGSLASSLGTAHE